MSNSGNALNATGRELHEAKLALRARVLDARSRLDAGTHARASESIAEALASRADFATAHTVCLTLPFGSEWNASLLAQIALDANKTVALPRVNTIDRMLELFRVRSLEHDVAPGFRGIPEPLAHCPPVALRAVTWILVPLVAFDDAGRRLGYGGGFYDRFLPQLDGSVECIAGAFALQRVERVPSAPHDLTDDAVVTELTTWNCGVGTAP
jgi:5-formyltetrahydrofolate cyclo-ligase